MRAGDLDRRAQILRRAQGVDSFGGSPDQWSLIGTVWASRADLTARERLAAGEQGASVTTRFAMRWSALTAGLGPGDRLRCDGREYEVIGLRQIGRREAVEVHAAARTESGA